MAKYDVGDLIFNEYEREGRLLCDGTSLVSSEYPGLNSVLSTNHLAQVDSISEAPGDGLRVAYSPDGDMVCIVSERDFVVLDAESLQIVSAAPSGNTDNWYFDCAFSPDGAYMAVTLWHTGDGNGAVEVYNTADWSLVTGTPTYGDNVRGVAFSDSQMALAIENYSGNALAVLELSDLTSEVAHGLTFSSAGSKVAFSPDGGHLAIGIYDDPWVEVVDVSGYTTETLPSFSATADDVAFSPDGSLLAVAYGDEVGFLSTSDWSLESTATIPDSGVNTTGVAFSPDSQLAVYTHETGGGFITGIDTSSWAEVTSVADLPSAGRGVAFNPDGKSAIAAHDGTPGASSMTSTFNLPDIPSNPHHPDIPVLIQAVE